MNDQLNEATKGVKNSVKEGADAFSDATSRAADSFRDAADRAKDAVTSSSMGRSASAFAEQAADRVMSAADYVRESEPEDLWADLVSRVKSRPVESMAVAIVLGFALGRVARRA